MSLVGGKNKEDGMKEPLVPADGEGKKGIGGVIFPADHAKVPVSAFVNPKHPGKVDMETLDPEAACVVIAAHSGGSDPNRVIKEIIAGSICLGLLVTVALAFLGGSYSLTHLVDYGGSSRYKGWCAVPYNYGQEVDVEQLLASDNAPFFFHERFTLDAEEDDFKTEIEVPDFKGGRHGRFLHDFRRNLTAIIDVTGGRCFVMPLDSRHVMRPSSLVDVLLQMNKGQYQVDTKVVRETMRVVYPPLENRMSLGIYISGACNNRDTFWLERFTQTTTFSSQRVEDVRVKREDNGPIALPVTQQREPEHVLKFTEFAGHNVVELDIVGLDGPGN